MAVRPAKSKSFPCASFIVKLPEMRSGPFGDTMMSVLSAIRLILLRLLPATILIPEASVAGNNHHTGFGNAKPPAVFVEVVANFDTGRNADVFINNDAPESGVPGNIDAVHQDAFINARIAVERDFRR